MLESLRRVFTRKASATTQLQVLEVRGADAVWTPRNYDDLLREGYEQTVWVYACIGWLTRLARGVKWMVKVGEDEVEEHPLVELMNRPNAMQSGSAFMESAYGYWLASGNSYIERVGVRNRPPVELWVKRPDRMKVMPDPRVLVRGYEYEAAGQKHVFDAWQVRHLKTWSPRNDWYGMSPLESAARGVDMFTVSQSHNLALLQNGARPSGAWVTQGSLTDEQYARLRHEVQDASRDLRERGRPLLLEGGVSWQELGLRPRDLDWLAGQADAARQIHAAFGVHPVVTGLSEGTYENQRQALRGLMLNAVLPFIDYLAGEVNEWLSPAYGDGVRLEYDRDAFPVLSEDQESLWRRADVGWGKGFLTRNEARVLVGYGELPAEKGDVFVNDLRASGVREDDGDREYDDDDEFEDDREDDDEDAGVSEDDDDREGSGRGRGRGRSARRRVPRSRRRRRRRDADEGEGEDEGERRESGTADRVEREGMPVATPLWARGRMLQWGSSESLLVKRVVLPDRFPVRDELEAERYWRARVALQESIERRWAKGLVNAFERERVGVTRAVRESHSVAGAVNAAERAVVRSGWEEHVMPWWYGSVLAGGEETLLRVVDGSPVRHKANAPGSMWFEYVFGSEASNVVAATNAHVPRLAGTIRKTTLDSVRRVIEEGVARGLGIARIAKALDELYLEDIIPNRSVVIARTEVIRATNFGSQAAARGTGLELEKVWLSTMDDRVRDSHEEAHGQVRFLDEPYTVGTQQKGYHQMMYPGDPNGPAHETIQCRCTEYYQEPTADVVPFTRVRPRSDERAVVVTLDAPKSVGRVNSPLPSPAGGRVVVITPERFRHEAIQSAYEESGVDTVATNEKLERIVTLERERDQYRTEWLEATDKKTERRAYQAMDRADTEARRLEADVESDMLRLREVVHDHLREHNPNPVGVLKDWQVGDAGGLGKKSVERNLSTVAEAREWLGSMLTQGPHVPEEAPVLHLMRAGGRSAYDPDTGVIEMENGVEASQYIHEYAHFVEARNPRVSAAMWDFYNRRTAGNPIEPLADIDPVRYPNSYDEPAKRDGGLNSYTWRFYGEGQPHTEVLSMGLMQMYDDPVRFAMGDPEHFDLTYRFLRNELEVGE